MRQAAAAAVAAGEGVGGGAGLRHPAAKLVAAEQALLEDLVAVLEEHE